MTGDFRFSHRWSDMLRDKGVGVGALGGVDRSIVDRLEQRDLEIEDHLRGTGITTFNGTTGTWSADTTTVTVTLPAATIGYTYYFQVIGGTEGGIFTVFTDSAAATFPIDEEGMGGVAYTALTGRTEGGAQTIPVRRLNSGGILALVGGAV